jgi:hypothetical protein
MNMDEIYPDGQHLLNRRSFLQSAGAGLGGIALSSLLADQGMLGTAQAKTVPMRPNINPTAPLSARKPHFTPKAKNVLVIFCSGACSHLDTWDYKPELIKRHGQPLPGGDDLVTFQGKNGNLSKSFWDFKPRGETGKMISDLLPNLAEMADDYTFIHSLTAESNTHGPAENQMSTGFTLDGFPSMGAWASYALGSDASDLPAFVAIPDPRGVPQSGPNNWSSGFLPAVFQGVPFNTQKPIPNLKTPGYIKDGDEKATREFLKFLNDKHLERFPGDNELNARISSYELAARMQLRAASMSDFHNESPETRKLYCIDDPNETKAGFGKNCLLARRLIEKGVRFVQLFNGAYAMGEGVGNWDGHKSLKDQYSIHAPILDEPAAGLIKDMRARGLLDDTLIVWMTEFGRMPTFQVGASGRDHNPSGFTAWMTGAGVKPGFSYGATDEFGYKAVENVTTIYDLHATILHLLGLDHERLSYYHNGIERRLTNVHGHAIKDIMA